MTAPIGEALALGAGIVLVFRSLASAIAQLVPELDNLLRAELGRQSHEIETTGLPLNAWVAAVRTARFSRSKTCLVTTVGLSLVGIAVSSASMISRLPTVTDVFGGSGERLLWLWFGILVASTSSMLAWHLPLRLMSKSVTIWRSGGCLLATLVLLHVAALFIEAAWQLPVALDVLHWANHGKSQRHMLEGLFSVGEVWAGLTRNRPLLLGWAIAAMPLAVTCVLSGAGILVAASPRVTAVIVARGLRAIARQSDPVMATFGDRLSWLAGALSAIADWLV
jgi:hypothetical protein